jgi:hypothetical protein
MGKNKEILPLFTTNICNVDKSTKMLKHLFLLTPINSSIKSLFLGGKKWVV